MQLTTLRFSPAPGSRSRSQGSPGRALALIPPPPLVGLGRGAGFVGARVLMPIAVDHWLSFIGSLGHSLMARHSDFPQTPKPFVGRPPALPIPIFSLPAPMQALAD
jgi:hypothetical protein